MDRVSREMDLQKIRMETGVTGEGITIAVLDTGIGRHPDLKEKTVVFQDFIGKRKIPYDDNGHGTHIAGIICGSGQMSKGKYAGIAPGVSLAVGKVLDRDGGGKVDDTLRGLEWILEIKDQYNIRIVNLSLGIADLKDDQKKGMLESRINQCWEEGLLVVTAAGNHCKMAYAKALGGKNSKAIVVGTKEGGPCNPDLVAWGNDIVSCDLKRGYTRKTGSSMATPIVSACAALLWESDRELTNEKIKEKMRATAQDLKLPWHIQGWGMINLRKLLT